MSRARGRWAGELLKALKAGGEASAAEVADAMETSPDARYVGHALAEWCELGIARRRKLQTGRAGCSPWLYSLTEAWGGAPVASHNQGPAASAVRQSKPTAPFRDGLDSQ